MVTASPMWPPLHWPVGSKNYMKASKTYMTTFGLWVIMLSSLAHVPIKLSYAWYLELMKQLVFTSIHRFVFCG